MKLKFVELEDFVNYKKPSMYLGFPYCNFKCEKDCGLKICQNSALVQQKTYDYNTSRLIEQYLEDDVTKAIVCGGLEPFDSWSELQNFIMDFRYHSPDPIIIYTGYTEEEVGMEKLNWIKTYAEIYPNIVKFGRFIPNQPHHIDPILGVELASPNQYAKEFIFK